MSVKLSVNLNAVAFLRNRRNLPWPDVTNIGRLALRAGANGITVHPRPDERHIRFSDLVDIRALLDNEFPTCEFNIEGYPTEHFLELVQRNQPDQVTLVPDSPEQSTSDHGWNFERDSEFLQSVINFLKQNAIRVSLFADPNPCGLKIARALGGDHIEFYTGPYSKACNSLDKKLTALHKLVKAAEHAYSLGFGVNAGHDLTVANLALLVKKIPFLSEVSVGHGLIADALEHGIRTSVRRFLNAL